MTKQISKGIKVSVETNFEGMFLKENVMQYAFSYEVTIENQSASKVQLISRFWEIKDCLGEPHTVIGEGVIGKKPILEPGEVHTYESGCILKGPFGAMKGHYVMKNFRNSTSFKVAIPLFKLKATHALN